MTTTVVDQLIVKLGLDPSGFTRGQKQAANEQIKLENSVKKSADSMGSSFVGLTKKLLGVAAVAVTLKKIIGYTSDMSTTLRQLGIDSVNYKIAASELRNFGNIAESMGGKTEDVTKTVANLSKAVYDLAYNGQISDSLLMLNRLGVRFQETSGEARDFKSIVMDSQNAIQGLMARGTSRENARHMLAQAGFDEGLIQAMLEGSVGTQLARQEQRRQVTGGDVGIATDWEKSAASRNAAAFSADLRLLPKQAAEGIAINKSLEAGADYAAGTETLQGVSDRVREAVPLYAAAIDGVSDALTWGAKMIDKASYDKRRPTGRAAYESTIQGAAKKYGMNPEMLAGLLKTESNFNPNVTSGKGAVGIAQFMPGTASSRGFVAGADPNRDIYEAARYLSELKNGHMADGNDEAAAWYLALQSYNAGDSRLRGSMKPGGKGLAKETLDYPGKVMEYASGARVSPNAGSAGGRGTIVFEEVNVNSNSTDGAGLARDFVDTTGRKLSAAHADKGVQ